ncbi:MULTISPECIES: metallophosphoesterase [Bacillus]|uniref:Phosphoesterase n=1 Tax=Bacillus thuringiensis serovar sooncheon TaxID=180891 RepID=A0A9Q5SKG8_BACTU|nr:MULTISPECIES: metallophosphoesterase [Bacillus]MDC7972982.1 metallophosphoesterase [Bacillus sp. BLCC-B18]OTW72542.1 phosphoesterase [Bacillus thuringiensis serovar coreanensis]OTX49598.1 phosphoesterase [Bacillus thuringiensis serovar sooncheon]OTX57225.1 phosphoesterase [Bacillus thuringiensis serovar guiyangiensis]OTX71931.1 phosphoesterase [Bacillus thuringiensis serovar roskildiensis]
MNKKSKRIILFIVTLIGISIFLHVQNNLISITEVNIKSSKIPSTFKGFKILQISDLHNKKFGDNQETLIQKVKGENPNIIVITGDLIDRKSYDAEVSMELIRELVKDYPIYFVTGNHEKWSGKYNDLDKELKKHHVIVLRNEHVSIQKGEQTINLLGIDDPAFVAGNRDERNVVKDEILKAKFEMKPHTYNVLLSHRPEFLVEYANEKIDLVLSGHAHGGQVRLPFIGGLVAPNQGIFPTYTAGLYEKQNTSMVVSRGLGNSVIPQRIFNRPELVVVQLN